MHGTFFSVIISKVYMSYKVQLRAFFQLLESYSIIPEDEKKLYEQKSSSITDPAKRREIKIAQYKKEKEIKNRISVCFQSAIRRQRPVYILIHTNSLFALDRESQRWICQTIMIS